MNSDASNLLYTDLSKNLRHLGTILLPFLVGVLALKYQYGTSDLDLPILLIAITFVGLIVASFGMLILRYKISRNKGK